MAKTYRNDLSTVDAWKISIVSLVVLPGLHLECGARGCKIVVSEIQGGGGRSSAYGPVAMYMYLPKSLLGGESSPGGGGSNTPSRPPKCSPAAVMHVFSILPTEEITTT